MIKEFLVKIKTVFDRQGMDEANRAERELSSSGTTLTKTNKELEAATQSVSKEQRRAIEVSQKLTAAASGSKEGIFSLAKEFTGLGNVIAKGSVLLSAWFAGWSVGSAIYEKFVKGWVQSLNKIPKYAEDAQVKTRKYFDELNEVKLNGITAELDRISKATNDAVDKLETMKTVIDQIRDAEQARDIARLHKEQPAGPERDAAEQDIRHSYESSKNTREIEDRTSRIIELKKRDAAYAKNIQETEAQIAESRRKYESMRMQGTQWSPEQTNARLESESSRLVMGTAVSNWQNEREKIQRQIQLEEGSLSAAQINRQTLKYTQPESVGDRARTFAQDRVAKEQAEAIAARSAYTSAVAKGAPQIQLNELAAKARKEQEEFAAASLALKQLLSGNAAKLQQIIEWMKAQNIKIKNLPTT